MKIIQGIRDFIEWNWFETMLAISLIFGFWIIMDAGFQYLEPSFISSLSLEHAILFGWIVIFSSLLLIFMTILWYFLSVQNNEILRKLEELNKK